MKKAKILSVMLGLVLGLGTLVGCTTPSDPTTGNTPTTGGQGQNQMITIEEAIAIAQQAGTTETTEKYTTEGTIKEITSTTWGNMVITDGTYEITVYGLYSSDGSVRYDAMTDKPVVGDTITVTGALMNYNDSKPEFVNAWLIELKKGEGNNNNQGSQGGNQGNGGATGSYADCEHSYDFSTFSGTSKQYADNEVHQLTSGLTITITDCYISKSLRMYKQDNEWGTYNGVLVSNAQSSAINAILVTIGDRPEAGKTCKLNFYGSTNGTDWTQVGASLVVEKNGSYSVDFSAANYTYFKIEAADYQTRITKLGVDLK